MKTRHPSRRLRPFRVSGSSLRSGRKASRNSVQNDGRFFVPPHPRLRYRAAFRLDARRMKIISWNVNGLRAALKKGCAEFIAAEQPDIVCFQETKATAEDVTVPPELAG